MSSGSTVPDFRLDGRTALVSGAGRGLGVGMAKGLARQELVEALGESQPKISRHLAQLRSAGVLVDRRQGQWVYYAINPKLADWALAVLDEAGRANQPALNAITKKLDRMKDRPNCC